MPNDRPRAPAAGLLFGTLAAGAVAAVLVAKRRRRVKRKEPPRADFEVAGR